MDGKTITDGGTILSAPYAAAAGRTTLVHKKDAEGALIIGAHNGELKQPLDERPEWAEGLAMALLGERLGFYAQRLGPSFTPEMKSPDLLAFEDLSWIALDGEGTPFELEADPEHRMEVLTTVLGLDRSGDASMGLTSTGHGNVIAEIEIALDRDRSPEEVAAIEKAQDAGFREATGT